MIIEMKNIDKFYGANQVLDHANFSIESGEVHALVGENGAGKSTLMNIMTGIVEKNGGEILIDGDSIEFSDSTEAERFGISFIHQELNNWEDMTVLENLFLNKEIINKFGLVDIKKMSKIANECFDDLNVSIDLNESIGLLTVGQQQMVEISKSLLTDAKIIIMDEPTAALTDKETKVLFEIIDDLKSKGVGIVYISHRMEEIFYLCDRITIMRDGLYIDTLMVSETCTEEIVNKMVGRDISDFYPEKTSEIGDVILEALNLSSKEELFDNINFKLHSGEILGFYGLMGAGRTEIMRAIYGLDDLNEGQLVINGSNVTVKSPSQAIDLGIGFLTENRKNEGLIIDFDVKDNITLPSIDGFKKKLLIDEVATNDFTNLLIERLLVKVQSSDDIVGQLSGGNQQKVVLAKWVGAGPKILILDEPTRGIDVGAKREIYELINELADRGVGIIFVSSDLPEVLGVCDRIDVVYEGSIQGELTREEANEENIMTLATGGDLNGE